MKLELLHMPDCPNVDLLVERLRLAIGDASLEVTRRVVVDATTAGMTGSPTLLIDGTDPFARAGLEPSLSCRLYPHEDGHLEGAPSVAELRRAVERCCTPTSGAATLRSTRRRAAPADPAARAT